MFCRIGFVDTRKTHPPRPFSCKEKAKAPLFLREGLGVSSKVIQHYKYDLALQLQNVYSLLAEV